VNFKLWVYLAEKMHMIGLIGQNLHSHDFRIGFCFHLAFLVLAYIPTPKGRALRFHLGNRSIAESAERAGKSENRWLVCPA
jgi:hypothetical protein